MDFEYQIGTHADAFTRTLSEWSRIDGTQRLWDKDPALWTGGDEGRWLGWMDAVDDAISQTSEWQRAAAVSEGCSDIMLLGMGGSSLCPEVFSRTFDVTGPALHVLDSTVPAQVSRFEGAVDLARTRFIVASKSGSTAEVSAFCSYFLGRCKEAVGAEAEARFTAITDPGSSLEKLAEEVGFGSVFLGEPTIGGRFSALSPFGLVPAAAYGIDVDALLANAADMVARCRPGAPDAENPGVTLGLLLGELALSGLDKLTIMSAVESLGGWLEQLLAESTGKDGRGIIPVDLEPNGEVGAYGDDRVFVILQVEGEVDPELDGRGKALVEAGHPVVTIRMPSRLHLGAEFFRWEMATAVAGWRLGIHPFDQPNVQESKDFTNRLTQLYESEGSLPEETPVLGGPDGDALAVYAEGENADLLKGCESVADALRAHLGRLSPGDYVGLCSFIDMTEEHQAALGAIRRTLRDRTRAATTLGFGPRFLHSTGQLHKGGPDSGVFIQLTADDPSDIPVPGKPFSFGVLKAAQAMGDLQALSARGRRCIRIHLGADVAGGLAHIIAAVDELKIR